MMSMERGFRARCLGIPRGAQEINQWFGLDQELPRRHLSRRKAPPGVAELYRCKSILFTFDVS